MEKVNHIVITRKEERDLKKVKRLFEIMGIDHVSMEARLRELEADSRKKDEEIASLKNELATAQEASEKLIRDQMKQISVNIQKSVSKDSAVKKVPFAFEGNHINENY